METKLHIGHKNNEFISIEVMNRSHPNAADYWDSNWLNTYVQCAFGSFKGSFSASLRTTEFLDFYKEIQLLNKTLEGKASFKTLEEQVILSLEGDSKGHVEISGKLKDEAGIGNDLVFHSSMDQTFLGKIEKELLEINERFPVLNEDKK